MTRAAQILYYGVPHGTLTEQQAEELAAAVKEAVRGAIEQDTANAEVRRAQQQGFCSMCGSDWY